MPTSIDQWVVFGRVAKRNAVLVPSWLAIAAGLSLLIAAAVGCGGDAAPAADAGALPGVDAGTNPGAPDAAGAPDAGTSTAACDAGPGGLACLFSQWDGVAGCDAALVAAFVDSVDARHGHFPAWHDTRALFVSRGGAAAIAGDFNDWDDTAVTTVRVCDSDVFAAELTIPSGRYEYKIVRDDTWQLDPESWAFAYDDFGGNPDGRNSVLNTYDSGAGHLVSPAAALCSDELGNCRPFTTYLPPGYGAPANATRTYPALFMHDGQNIFDDTSCCFGFGGWQVNVTLDAEITAGRVAPVVVVGFDNAGAGRTGEYGYAEVEGGARETFMAFQVERVQPAAFAYWRLDAARVYTAGSSLGGHLALALAFAYPDVYAGAASLSGSFWVGEDTNTAVSDIVAVAGMTGQQLYIDHGGTAAAGGDNYASNVELRDQLASMGWHRQDWSACDSRDDAPLCYFHDTGAQHNELEWRGRSHQFLRFLFPAE